jgi:hypothetical protein
MSDKDLIRYNMHDPDISNVRYLVQGRGMRTALKKIEDDAPIMAGARSSRED